MLSKLVQTLNIIQVIIGGFETLTETTRCIKFNRTMHNKYATVWKVHSLIVRKPHTGSNWHFALPDWLRTNKLILERKYTVLGDAPGFAREIMLGESEVWNIPRHSLACGLSLLPPFIAITFSHIKSKLPENCTYLPTCTRRTYVYQGVSSSFQSARRTSLGNFQRKYNFLYLYFGSFSKYRLSCSWFYICVCILEFYRTFEHNNTFQIMWNS